MRYYKVRNWEKYQHYSKRNPPWVKLHFELLASADWVTLSDASRVLAVACMLLASRNDGKVPGNPEYIKRVAYLHALPDFTELLACGFLEDASNLLADASVSVSVSDSVSDSVSEGGLGETKEVQPLAEHAEMAREFWFGISGTTKPTLSELSAEFEGKLKYLDANGRGQERVAIWSGIRDPTRDKTKVKTIRQMYIFWDDIGIGSGSNGRRHSKHQRDPAKSAGGGAYEGIKPSIVKLPTAS